MTNHDEAHAQFYFTLQEMGYIASLVAQRPYAEVADFMAKIKQQYALAEAKQRTAAPAPPTSPATPEPYQPYVDRPQTTETEKASETAKVA